MGSPDPFIASNQIFIGLAFTIIYGWALYATKRNVLHVICGIMFSWAYYAFVANLIKGSGFGGDAIRDIAVYTSMILGFAYLSYSLWLKKLLKKEYNLSLRRAASIYNVCGFLFVLMPALALTGAWDVLYALLAIGAVAVSVNLRSTSGLIVSAVAIAFYVIHMSVKYFADSIGWAFMLVIIGFLIIGIGYLTYWLNRKYIAKA
jgi:hypothetical protein